VRAQVEAHDEAHEFLSETERKILETCGRDEQSSQDLLNALGYTSRTGNFKKALSRLLLSGAIERTNPLKLRSKNQRYRITEKGRKLVKGP
jgi:ATP-dependent DNA helicase RecG